MRYILGLFVIGLLILIGVLAFSGNKQTTKNAPLKLADIAQTTKQVRFTIDGPTNADEDHRQIQITVDSTLRQINVFQGYQQTIIRSQSADSNQSAFTAFLKSLDNAGFTKEAANRNQIGDDERGACPLGDRFVMEVIDNGKDQLKLWTTSCGRRGTTFAGNISTVESLFQNQIHGYRALVSDTGL